MNTLIRAASRIALGPVKDRIFVRTGPAINKFIISKRWGHNFPLTYDFARERIMLVLHLYDKIDPNKLTLDAHFVKDLGLDSLDHMDIVMQIEDEFQFEIPDQDVDRLQTPRDIVTYITDKEEAYEELQQLSHHHHHDHDHGHSNSDHHSHHGDHKEHDQHIESAGIHNSHAAVKPQVRSFCTSSARFESSDEKKIYETSFNTAPAQEVNFDDIQNRVMKVLSKYDKIDSSQLQLASHFVNDLGLDSLDHVEIMMELEDEFGIEIPDQEAEKLLRPAEVARFIFQKESERVPREQDRPF